MAKDPADRQQRPADLIADLLGIAEQEGIDVSAAPSSTVAAVESAVAVAAERASPLPWVLPVAGLALTVGWLWWASPAANRTTPSPRADAKPEAGEPAPASRPVPSAPWRVVEVPAGDRETSSLAEAAGRAAPGEIIELAYDGIHDEPPIAVAGLTVRAGAGHSPTVRFSAAAAQDGTDGPPTAAWSIGTGTLTIEGVHLVLVAGGFTSDRALFSLGDGATLSCTDVRLEIRSGDDIHEPPVPTSATLIRAAGSGADRPSRSDLQFNRTVAEGAGDVLRVSGDRQVGVIWSGGRCAVTGAFLVAEGGSRATGPGPTVSLSLADATFACQAGFARLLDSPARPAIPCLRAFADTCRFALPDGAALLEQAGIEQPDRYRGAVDWLDGGSRYEGSGVFRRIDGSAERVEADYASAIPPLVHTATIGDDVDAMWTGGPDS
ncbi:MAG: hypothetical protein EBZ59_11790 [Planctomycetia bacterium]|nr:hypothetical protein [Planctomycetia bacterium]